MWKIGKTIGDREGRMDACVAGAGILPPTEPCLTYSAKTFQEASSCCVSRRLAELKLSVRPSPQVFDVNVNGALFTAQAAGQQMERFGKGGSIILIASINGHRANKVGLAFSGAHYRVYVYAAFGAGIRMDIVQRVQVRGAPDGTQHGGRAGREGHSRELDQSGP